MVKKYDAAFRAALHLDLARAGKKSRYGYLPAMAAAGRVLISLEDEPLLTEEALQDLYALADFANAILTGGQQGGRPRVKNPSYQTLKKRESRAGRNNSAK